MWSTSSLLVLMLVSISEIRSQAPGDEDSTCTINHPDAPIYPDTEKNLMDSWSYINLLPGNGTGRNLISSAVWNDYSYDENDADTISEQTYWQQTTGENCRFSSKVCGWRRSGATQNNWLFTQHISKSFDSNTYNYPVTIHVNMSYTMSGCRSRNGCLQELTLYHYLTNSVQLPSLEGNGYMNPDNYQDFSYPYAPENGELYVNIYNFTLPSSSTGFYIAVQDNGTCMTVQRLRVYRSNCRGQKVGLVTYPDAPAPESSSVTVTVKCADHSSTERHTTCSSDGTWGPEEPQCICDNGYMETNDTNEEGETTHSCIGCLENTYRNKMYVMHNCIPCPENSYSEGYAPMCECKENFFRAEDEDITDPCTTSPSRPANCSVEAKDSSVTVTWDLPEEDGGRNDLYFKVCICELLECSDASKVYCIHHTNGTSYTFSGLKPVTVYRVEVTAENGVSEQDARIERRTCTVEFPTSEGAPECVHNPKSVDNFVLVWGPPIVPNGIITGYRVRLEFCATEEESDDEGSGASNETLYLYPQKEERGCTTTSYDLAPDTFFFVLNNDVLPDYSHNLTYNIQARTGEDRYGTWCPNETIVPKFVCPPPPVCECMEVIPAETTTTLIAAPSATTKSTPTTTTSTACPPTPASPAASLESCAIYMAGSAGVFLVISSLLSCLFACVIACLCHKHKMKNYKVKVKKHLQSKWDY